MDRIANFLFSMRMMTVGLIIFLVAIAKATFIESEWDIQTARLLVYNALWFEILLIFLSMNLIANIVNHRLFQREKAASFAMHVSFLVIMVGAAVTRFTSFEGQMLVREGEKANFIYSADPYLWFEINDGKSLLPFKSKLFQTEKFDNEFSYEVGFPGQKHPVTVDFVQYEKNVVDTLIVNDSITDFVLDIVSGGMSSNYLAKGDFITVNNLLVSFEDGADLPGLRLKEEQGKILFTADVDVRVLAMAQMREARQSGMEVPDSAYQLVPAGEQAVFQTATLYNVGGEQVVFKGKVNNAKMMRVKADKKDEGTNFLTVKVAVGEAEKIVELEGGMGRFAVPEMFSVGDLNFEMQYGPMEIEVPFEVLCRDFQLERYPGSDSPSSFASELTIIDTANNFRKDKRIFMNHVYDYKGYRLFQSGYDPDEKGTRLSVNHDFWGTQITYVGYLLMAIGMIMTLLTPNGRFRELRAKLKKINERKAALMVAVMCSLFTFAQDGHEGHNHAPGEGHEHHNHQSATAVQTPTKPAIFRVISESHSEELANLPIQDYKGRIIPFHTLCDQLLRKIHRGNKYKDFNAVQTVLSMHMYPDYWMNEPMIYVSSNLRENLGITDKYISYKGLIGEAGGYVMADEYNKAFQTMESKRGEFEKKLIKLTERFQVVNQIFGWVYMKLIPLQGNSNNQWVLPLGGEMSKADSAVSRQLITYIDQMNTDAQSNSFDASSQQLATFKMMQRKAAGEVMPDQSTIDMEVSYNKMNIFKNTSMVYMTVGLLMLILYFIQIFKGGGQREGKVGRILKYTFKGVLLVTMAYHATGLGMRWGITGHAPWSNGYEAVVFIAFVTMLAGFIFSKNNIAVLAGTAVLAFLMIFVTEMNLMDPEITPLQPVLKSYWLMIHVAIITGSYGFLGLACILGLLNLILYIFRNQNNAKSINLNISELTYVSEMTMTVGLMMLTIGTFLGGIWANESWGRYWGWDPKETWALVSVLVYAVILHLRFIPGLKSKFIFNLVSLWGYSAILFTFFGVNFFLVGLHSYAQGEGLGEFPMSVKITVVIFVLFSAFAAWRNRQFKKSNT